MCSCSATLGSTRNALVPHRSALLQVISPQQCQQCCQGPFCQSSFWPSYVRSKGMRNRRCPFSGTASAMASVNHQKKQRKSTTYQVGPPQSVSLYICGWTAFQPHFCKVLVHGTGRAHLFPKTRSINLGIKIFSLVVHSNMYFSGKMTETLQGTVLEFTVPS